MILRTKRAHLVLKAQPAVVRPLRLDVLNQRPKISWTHGEQTISTLPGKVFHALLLHPGRRPGLDLRHDLRRNFSRGQTQRQVNVVWNATGAEAFASQFPRCPRQIGVQGLRKFVGYQPLTAFRTEDDMHQIETQRLRHARDYMSGLQPSTKHSTAHLGLRPRLVCCRAFRPLAPSDQPLSRNRGHNA